MHCSYKTPELKRNTTQKRGHPGQSLLTWDSVQKYILDTGSEFDWETKGSLQQYLSSQ